MSSVELVLEQIKKESVLRKIAQSLYWRDELTAKNLKRDIGDYILNSTACGLAGMWIAVELSRVDWDQVARLLMEEAALGASDSWTIME